MHNIKDFGAAEDVAITVLVDNRADLIVKSTDTVKRFTEEPLLAEHGFSALVDLKAAGVRILWDAGITRIVLLENMRRMELDTASIDKIALSHGHGDHTASVAEVLNSIPSYPEPREWEPGASHEDILAWVKRREIPIVAHPAAFRERWGFKDDGGKYGPIQPPPGDEWSALGGRIVLSDSPHQLEMGCWTTGGIPRLSFESVGIPKKVYYREGENFLRDEVEDDQAVVINIKDKGLVILSGCAHSGIVNTVNYARQLSGVDQVYAILGGFHLARATDEDIQRTVDALSALQPTVIVPSHCTGFRATAQFAEQIPEAFVLGLVGTTYIF